MVEIIILTEKSEMVGSERQKKKNTKYVRTKPCETIARNRKNEGHCSVELGSQSCGAIACNIYFHSAFHSSSGSDDERALKTDPSSEGFMPSDENRHFLSRYPRRWPGRNTIAAPPSRAGTTVYSGRGHGTIPFLRGSPSEKSEFGGAGELVRKGRRCRRISLASSRVGARMKDRQFNFNCLRTLSCFSSTSVFSSVLRTAFWVEWVK
jgi:hypothetical protein